MNTAPKKPVVVWYRTAWKLKRNPFPAEAITAIGTDDDRENGRLFRPEIQTEQVDEAIGKFVLGAVYDGQRFGALWSQSTVMDPDSRGYGKSGLMQYLTYYLNDDFGRSAFQQVGLDASDADDYPVCALLASFDVLPTKNLNNLFFAAVQYAVNFRMQAGHPSLFESLYQRLASSAGTDDPAVLSELCGDAYRALRGRTIGAPDERLLAVLCGGETRAAQDYLNQVTDTKRTRSGANFLATFLLFIRAAGVQKVMFFCDQLEDFASPQTPKKTRGIEVERFRDFVLELLPMADMLSVVVTMHPRALASIEEFWQLADLPSLRVEEANRHMVVVMPPLGSPDQAKRLLRAYLDAARGNQDDLQSLAPFTEDAIEEIWAHSSKKPRDLLRKAHKMVTFAASENLRVIDAPAVAAHLSLLMADDDLLTGQPPGLNIEVPDFS